MVVSVGPYMFQSSPQRGSSSFASSGGSGSPPHRTLRMHFPSNPQPAVAATLPASPASPSLPLLEQLDQLRAVHRDLARHHHDFAPVVRGSSNSNPAMSKDNVVMASRTSSALMPGSRRID